MNDTTNQNDSWEACPSGALTEMVHRAERQQRKATVARYASALAVVVLLGTAIGVATRDSAMPQSHPPSHPQGHLVGGIYCAECIPLIVDYDANRLDAERTDQVRLHLAGCTNCREKYEKHQEARSEARGPQRSVGYLSHFHAAPPRVLARNR